MTLLPRRLVRPWVLPFIDPRQHATLALLPCFFVELHNTMGKYDRAVTGRDWQAFRAKPSVGA